MSNSSIVTDINVFMCNLILEIKDIGDETYFKSSLAIDKTSIYLSTYKKYNNLYAKT